MTQQNRTPRGEQQSGDGPKSLPDCFRLLAAVGGVAARRLPKNALDDGKIVRPREVENQLGDVLGGGVHVQQVKRFAERLERLTLEGTTVAARETVARRIGRVRDVRQGPDGYIYLAIEDRDGKPTPVVRLEPIDRTTVR